MGRDHMALKLFLLVCFPLDTGKYPPTPMFTHSMCEVTAVTAWPHLTWFSREQIPVSVSWLSTVRV